MRPLAEETHTDLMENPRDFNRQAPEKTPTPLPHTLSSTEPDRAKQKGRLICECHGTGVRVTDLGRPFGFVIELCPGCHA